MRWKSKQRKLKNWLAIQKEFIYIDGIKLEGSKVKLTQRTFNTDSTMDCTVIKLRYYQYSLSGNWVQWDSFLSVGLRTRANRLLMASTSEQWHQFLPLLVC